MLKTIFIAAAFILAVTALVLGFYDKDKTVYIDTGKIYAEFELTRELNKNLEAVVKARNVRLDSLYEQARLLSIEIKAEQGNKEKMKKFKMLEEEYTYKKQKSDEENRALTSEYNDKIWGQLNQYIKDYGKSKNYAYILGANGQGSVMYAKDANNITEDVLKYVNEKYAGKK